MSLAASNHLYDKHFGFLDLPFSITPNPRFPYDNAHYREAFATLRYGIEARKGFIVITGEVGTGKTTLLKAVMQSVQSTVHTAFIFNPKLSFSQLLRSILTDLGISEPGQDRFTLMAKLNDYLIEQLKRDHIVAILIDEAQDLSDELLEEIRLLSNLETDRSRLIQIVLMGQPEFEQTLDQPHLRQLKQRIALRCRLTPLQRGEVGSYINYRLKTAGYQGKELFEAKAVEKISLNSQGIPRLINVICDNALLIAYASSKRKVSAEMIEEVARDLRLTVPATTQGTDSEVDSKGPRGRDEGHDKIRDDEPRLPKTRHPKFEEFSIEEATPPELYPKSGKKGLRIGAWLVLLLTLGVGAVLYAQQDRNLVSDVVVKIEDYSEQSRIYLSELAETMNPQIRHSFSDAAANIGDYLRQSRIYLSQKMGDYLPQGKEYLSALAVKAQGLIATQFENLKQADLIPTSQDDRANDRLTDFPGLQSNNDQGPAIEEPGSMTERSNQAQLNENAAPTPATQVEERIETGDGPKTQPVKPQIVSPESEPVQPDREITAKREQSSLVGNFEVVQDSYLRDKPQSDAAITTLAPGTRIRVESKNGDYLRVRSLDDPGLRGYVHRQDAFFERIR
jgi:general secretion pathway protein A